VFVTAKKLERKDIEVMKLMEELELTHERIEKLMRASRDDMMQKYREEEEGKQLKNKI
jgi:hypothetical protein